MRRLFAVIVCEGLLILACGGGAAVEGQVQTHHKKPLEGVKVKVLKSTYEATSGTDGKYSVSFAPGTFEIQYSRSGFTTETVELNIQQETSFPAEAVVLYPIPTESGLHYLGEQGLVGIEDALMDVQTTGGAWSSTKKFFCTGEGSLSIPAGKVEFIDTSDEILMVAKLGGYGLVYAPENSYSDDDPTYNGLFQDEKSNRGAEGLVVRSFDVEPGQYAWVRFKKNRAGETTLDATQPCSPFKVVAGN
jgi:hypothetical protein